MVRRVEPHIGCAELGLKVPKPFRMLGWKIHGTNRQEMQRKRTAGDKKRLGDIPRDAQHAITVAFRDNPGTHGKAGESVLDVIEQGKRECEWTERESVAVEALTCALEQEVQRAGYRSMAEFQRSSASEW